MSRRYIIHLDMDAFFAAVEVLDNPELAGKCLVVGSDSKRGVVAAASYQARRHGIHSAMPMFQARRRCTDLVIVNPHRKRYRQVSRQVMVIIKTVSPQVEQVSIDEAYVDITGCQRLYGSPVETAKYLKQRIQASVGLSCTTGIAPNKFLAKIASDMNKPDGLTIIEPNEVSAFIEKLPIQKVPGVGKHAREALNKIGVHTLGDISKLPENVLIQRLGKFGHRLIELSKGVDKHRVVPHTPTKSISSEETLSTDTSDKEELKTHLMRQAEGVGRQLRRENLRARTVTIKIKHADFKQVSRSKTIKRATQSSDTLYREASQLLQRYRLMRPVRLIGMGVSSLSDKLAPVQLNLFDAQENKDAPWEQVDHVVDAITAKFGKNSIGKARLGKKER